jgi:ribosome-associated protein
MSEEYEEFEELGKSKSQVKRELQELHALGKKLVELPDKHLEQVPVSDALRDAISAAKKMKLTALKRQLKFIAGLMQEEDEIAILAALDEIRKPHKQGVEQFHEVEQWRDHLLQGNQDLINDLAEKFENFERQRVNQLIRNAKKEQTNNKPPKSSRLLFKYLAELQGIE